MGNIKFDDDMSSDKQYFPHPGSKFGHLLAISVLADGFVVVMIYFLLFPFHGDWQILKLLVVI